MADAIKPTVGRIVHFFSAPGATQRAAIVTCVHSDSMVNLCVFTENGAPYAETSVQLAPGSGGRMWSWPPRS